MADPIITAPRWWREKWQWIPRLPRRCVVCVSMNFDPDDPPAELFNLVHRRPVVLSYGINGPPIRAPNWSGAQIQRRKEFADRSAILHSQLYEKADGDVFDLRACAAVLARAGQRELAELLATTDRQQVAHNEKRTERAHDKRETEGRHREWQEAIDGLAREHPEQTHTGLCRILDPRIGVRWQTIRRNTKLGHS